MLFWYSDFVHASHCFPLLLILAATVGYGSMLPVVLMFNVCIVGREYGYLKTSRVSELSSELSLHNSSCYDTLFEPTIARILLSLMFIGSETHLRASMDVCDRLHDTYAHGCRIRLLTAVQQLTHLIVILYLIPAP